MRSVRDLRGFEILLQKERARLRGLLRTRFADIEIPGLPTNHPAEAAGALYEREVSLSFKAFLLLRLAEVNAALQRIHGGTYGLCELCGRPIARARLEAVPTARRRVACQQRLERALGRKGLDGQPDLQVSSDSGWPEDLP